MIACVCILCMCIRPRQPVWPYWLPTLHANYMRCIVRLLDGRTKNIEKNKEARPAAAIVSIKLQLGGTKSDNVKMKLRSAPSSNSFLLTHRWLHGWLWRRGLFCATQHSTSQFRPLQFSIGVSRPFFHEPAVAVARLITLSNNGLVSRTPAPALTLLYCSRINCNALQLALASALFPRLNLSSAVLASASGASRQAIYL